MLEPGKMGFCKECQHYEEVDQCTHSYFSSPASPGPIGSGEPGGGGGTSIMLAGVGLAGRRSPKYDCPYFEKK